jgi:hypothetical protein
MRDIWQPLEKSWVTYLALLSIGVLVCAQIMHWKTAEWIAGISGLGCCLRIAERQIETLKDHIEKLEDRVDDLEARTR